MTRLLPFTGVVILVITLGCTSLFPPSPTPTPYPTYTPYPTLVALPTYTPYPTSTPEPTHTPYPTSTPRPTYTPYPTATPRPTYTPIPTPRPRTVFLVPTPVPTPAPKVEFANGVYFALYQWWEGGEWRHQIGDNGAPCVAVSYIAEDGLYYPYDQNQGWGCDYLGYYGPTGEVYVLAGGGPQSPGTTYQAIPISLESKPISRTAMSNEDGVKLLSCLAGAYFGNILGCLSLLE